MPSIDLFGFPVEGGGRRDSSREMANIKNIQSQLICFLLGLVFSSACRSFPSLRGKRGLGVLVFGSILLYCMVNIGIDIDIDVDSGVENDIDVDLDTSIDNDMISMLILIRYRC